MTDHSSNLPSMLSNFHLLGLKEKKVVIPAVANISGQSLTVYGNAEKL